MVEPLAKTTNGNGRRRVSGMERAALATYAYLDERFRIRNVADKIGDFYMSINMQLPRSHTEKYKLRSIWYWYPMYTLGSLSFLAFILAAISGVILTFWFVPSVGTVETTAYGTYDVPLTEAWVSVAYIMTEVPFGFIMRALHFWSAMVMVAAVFLHMMRCYWTQAYKKPRELNWLLGFLLFFLTMGLGYTGYILPWNQLGYWAGTIGNEMAAATPPQQVGRLVGAFVFGTEFGTQQTMSRMYILHVVILPILTFTLIFLHIAIVWIQGIAEPH